MLLSIDLSQIEVLVFAYYCRDKTICRLLKDGLDVHEYMLLQTKGLSKDNLSPEAFTEERKKIKAVTFGIIYGNGAFKLSETLGIDQDTAKEYINTFYEVFPGAKTWHNKILREVESNGYLLTPTQRLLKFTKFEAKFAWQKKDKLYYNPPDIKNWPVQSFAGDIYKLLCTQIYRNWLQLPDLEKENIKLINTIHDSIMLDIHPDYEKQTLNLVTFVLDNYEKLLYTTYKINFDLPIRYTLSKGKSWADLQEFKLEETTNDISS